jgi:predicted RNase H-like HicB family nuclease
MQIPVLIEPIAGNGYRARGAEPFAHVAEGPTREAALNKLKEQLQARLQAGAEIVTLDLPAAHHPWMEFAGMYSPDDPLVQDWKEAMAEYRRKIDEHPERP